MLRYKHGFVWSYFWPLAIYCLSNRASLVAQMLEHLAALLETWVRSLGWEDPLEKEMATHSSILAWSTPWTEEPGGLQSTGLPRVRHDWVTSLSEKLYTLSKNKTGGDCGSDDELIIAKFRLKLKKVGKTTRTFRYDLSQIPYDYTVKVTNRFKGLDLIECISQVSQLPVQILHAK